MLYKENEMLFSVFVDLWVTASNGFVSSSRGVLEVLRLTRLTKGGFMGIIEQGAFVLPIPR